jgi:hypothetical protein
VAIAAFVIVVTIAARLRRRAEWPAVTRFEIDVDHFCRFARLLPVVDGRPR